MSETRGDLRRRHGPPSVWHLSSTRASAANCRVPATRWRQPRPSADTTTGQATEPGVIGSMCPPAPRAARPGVPLHQAAAEGQRHRVVVDAVDEGDRRRGARVEQRHRVRRPGSAPWSSAWVASSPRPSRIASRRSHTGARATAREQDGSRGWRATARGGRRPSDRDRHRTGAMPRPPSSSGSRRTASATSSPVTGQPRHLPHAAVLRRRHHQPEPGQGPCHRPGVPPVPLGLPEPPWSSTTAAPVGRP
jgi:hypothetical protein